MIPDYYNLQSCPDSIETYEREIQELIVMIRKERLWWELPTVKNFLKYTFVTRKYSSIGILSLYLNNLDVPREFHKEIITTLTNLKLIQKESKGVYTTCFLVGGG